MKTENLVNKLCSIYLVLMFTIPLFIFNDYYYDITITKYKAFSYITLVSLLFIFITFIVLMIKKKAIKLNLKELSQHISKTDLCLILFVLTCIFSTVFSANSTEAWNGSLGRYMGLYSILLCAGSYFVVSRFYKLQQSILLVFLVSVFLVELLGVFHYFSVDVFGFYEYLSDYYGNLYISTIGNVNFFAALTCLSLPFGIVLYCAAKERLSNIIYFILTVMNYLAVFISNSDGAHIASVIMLIVIGLYAMSNYEYFKKYLQLLAAYIVSAKLLGLLTMQIGTGHFLHTISSVLAYHPSVYLILLTIGVIYSLLVYKKAVFMSEQNMKKIKSIFCKYVFIGFVLLLIIIILYNMEILKIPFPYIENYLKFNRSWGTGRGNIWSMVLEAWQHQPFLQKLIGIGPDTMRPMVFDFYQNAEILAYDNAHNELIQYMITTGILGVICYVGLNVTVIRSLFSHRYKEPFSFALLCVVLCYFIQSLFNISQPITTPLFFIMLGIAQSFIREEAKTESKSNQSV